MVSLLKWNTPARLDKATESCEQQIEFNAPSALINKKTQQNARSFKVVPWARLELALGVSLIGF